MVAISLVCVYKFFYKPLAFGNSATNLVKRKSLIENMLSWPFPDNIGRLWHLKSCMTMFTVGMWSKFMLSKWDLDFLTFSAS